MPDRDSFDYAVIRVVPHVERQEFINIGLIVFSRRLKFLEAMIDFDLHRLKAFAPECDFQMIRKQLETITAICAGSTESGHFAELNQSERFNWLVAPRSTIIQTSPVHSGISDDPAAALKQLYRLLVV